MQIAERAASTALSGSGLAAYIGVRRQPVRQFDRQLDPQRTRSKPYEVCHPPLVSMVSSGLSGASSLAPEALPQA